MCQTFLKLAFHITAEALEVDAKPRLTSVFLPVHVSKLGRTAALVWTLQYSGLIEV